MSIIQPYLFEFDYNDERFIIELHYVVEAVDKSEVLTIKYSDDPDDSDEYAVKIFRVNNEVLTPIKITDLPKQVQDNIATELQKVLPTDFIANPYFDELMIFFGNTVLTSQDKFIPFTCDQCHRVEIYEKREKKNKGDYVESIRSKLLTNPNPLWPFKGRLQIQFSVSDKQSRLNSIDFDNLAKSILDSLQTVVFENDAQIEALVATKDYTNGFIANLIAIKELGPDERPKFQEFLFSSKHKTWSKEYAHKFKTGKSTRFVRY